MSAYWNAVRNNTPLPTPELLVRPWEQPGPTQEVLTNTALQDSNLSLAQHRLLEEIREEHFFFLIQFSQIQNIFATSFFIRILLSSDHFTSVD